MVGNVEQQMLDMLIPVAEALGEDLLPSVAFIGGSTVALLITDPITRQAVRFTQDVDLILHAEGHAHWQRLLQQLRERGFRESAEDEIICRMRLGEVIVDFMPDDERILGFSNRWYQLALANAQPLILTEQITINVLTPVYFIATKLEAYHGRGDNSPISSHDLEDIINLVDGRATLLDELQQNEAAVCDYVALQFTQLLKHRDFDYAVQGNIQDRARSDLFFQRWQAIADLTNKH